MEPATSPVATEQPAPAAVKAELPVPPEPTLPPSGALFPRVLALAFVLLGLFLLDRLAIVLMDYWLLESLGFEGVFWTNFWTGTALFVLGLAAVAAAVAVPAFVTGLPRRTRRRAVALGVFAGLVAGFFFAGFYQGYLLFFKGKSFGAEDPVFGRDIGFYVFDLPAIFTTLHALVVLLLVALLSSVACAWMARPPGTRRGPVAALGTVSTPLTLAIGGVLGVVLAAEVWFSRYSLLTKENLEASIPNGPQALDVSGFFSTKNAITLAVLVTLLTTAAVISKLRVLHRGVQAPADPRWRSKLRPAALAWALLPAAIVEVAFLGFMAIRANTEITPNEPAVQFPYIQRHIDATNTAYGLDEVEVVPFTPKGPGDERTGLGKFFDSPTVQNAPLWPGYHSRLERLIDPEYVDRVLETGGDTTIYGPTLDTYQQQEKLRPYYDFMDVDTVRYRVNGEQRLFASAVRELPLIEPQPWLAWWGQRFVVFTHGYGLVMSELSGVDQSGEPVYASRGIPSQATSPELAVRNQAVYYGEGAGSVGYSNVRRIKEHDYPTEQGRAQISYPEDVDAGVKIDSPLKRLVFGWKSRQLVDILFSDLIDSDSRIHYFRQPLDRIRHIAPFLYLDTDPYAVATPGGIQWMVNGMTTTDRYPYSAMGELGDKSDRRTPLDQPTRMVNYVADSVKGVVDAYTGKVRLYKWQSEPVVDTWASIYPDLFEERETMPARLRDQVQYPVQLMHIQFDDLYIYYHQKDALTFFSQEDLFDDGDEVVGPILDEGEAISFSIEPYYWLAETGRDLPASSSRTQFAMSTIFTPENAVNLRAIATAYMNGEDYGKLSILEVPKGKFFPGPEQADSAIDQDAFISQQIGLWTRLGLEVIRGHTTPLVVAGEVLYIEPLFIRSKQNPIPQLKRVIVVLRGQAGMGRNMREALKAAMEGPPTAPLRPGPELGGVSSSDAQAPDQGVAPDEGGGGPPPQAGGGPPPQAGGGPPPQAGG
jgi:uncharacterized protein